MPTESERRAFEAHIRRLMRTVDKVEEREVRQVLRELRDARGHIDDRITAMLARREPRSEFGPAQARAIRDEIDRVTSAVWLRFGRRLGEVDRELIEVAGGAQLEGIDKTTPQAIVGGPALSENLVVTSARYKALLIGRSDGIVGSADEQRDRLSRIVRSGVLTGRSPREISLEMSRSGWLGPLRRSDGTMVGVGARADTIARTEVNGTFNIASQVTSETLGKSAPQLRIHKTWVTAGDDRVRDSHAEAGARYAIGGEIGPIPFDEDFEVGDETAAMPHDPRLSAGERVNCRCRSVSMSGAFLAEKVAA